MNLGFAGGGMAEVVDAADLKSADGNVVGVQVPLPPSTSALPAHGRLQAKQAPQGDDDSISCLRPVSCGARLGGGSWDSDLATYGDLQSKGLEVFSAGLGRLVVTA